MSERNGNGKSMHDRSPDRRSNHSADTHRTKRSHRSRSPRSHKYEEGRTRTEGSHRDRERDRERGHHREHRDRDRERDRERDRRRDRDPEDIRHGRDRDDRDDRDRRERRRKRDEDLDDPERRHREERSKRRRDEDGDAPMASPSDRLHRRDDRGIPDRPPRSYDGRDDSTSRHRDRGREPEVPREPSLTGREPRSIRAKSPSPLLDDEERLPMSRSAAAEAAARRASPTYEPPSALGDGEPQPVTEDDSEARSVFVSQLAARLTARDLGYFFEDKLGEGAVIDSRIVTDRLSRRSKGIGYVEFRSIDLVPKAIALSGTIVMGLPIMVQLTEAERNRTHAADGIHLPPGVSAPHHGPMQLYVGSLHFNLTESDIKQVFEPFGELEFVDLHRDPMTGRSKGYAFVQYKRPEDAKMALEQMEGFELAGRTLRVNTVHEKGSATRTQQDSLDENGGGNLNAASRQALMQKLARIDTPPSKTPDVVKPNVPQTMTTRCVLLRNMFNPEEETERDWDKDLADDVKKEAESKYGKVTALKVEPQSDGEIYVKFDAVDSATKAVAGLNGRWFGGRQIAAAYISDAIMQAHL